MKKSAVVTVGLLAMLAVGAVWIWADQDSSDRDYRADEMRVPLRNQIRVGTWVLEDVPEFSEHNLRSFMVRYTREPHPMGSPEQKALAREIRFLLQSFGWQARLQSFSMKGPNLNSSRFGGDQVMASRITTVRGENVIGYFPGPERCVVLVGGHYDSKFFREFRFVGANDGGSSTVLMLELARLIPKLWVEGQRESAGAWNSCGLVLAFFDGEEALLPGWYDGLRATGYPDHIYGSRAFVESMQKAGGRFLGQKMELALIIDMVGHLQQKLFITKGSAAGPSETLESMAIGVKIRRSPFQIDDDHVPFREAGIPHMHVIDWTNLKEWHTVRDTMDIIDHAKIAQFGALLKRFLATPRGGNVALSDSPPAKESP